MAILRKMGCGQGATTFLLLLLLLTYHINSVYECPAAPDHGYLIHHLHGVPETLVSEIIAR